MNGGELAVLFCFIWLFICVAGPGPISADALRR
jgi:putative oxidoreductase